jgi:hypothetical protein
MWRVMFGLITRAIEKSALRLDIKLVWDNQPLTPRVHGMTKQKGIGVQCTAA